MFTRDRRTSLTIASLLLLLTSISTAAPVTRFAYVANTNDNTISCYAFDPLRTSKELRSIGYALTGGTTVRSLTIVSDRFLYAVNKDSNNVSIFKINSNGTLNRLGRMGVGSDPYASTSDPLGRFLFVANSESSDISVFAVNSSTGALIPVPGSPFTSNFGPRSLATDASGKFLFVANVFTNTLTAFRIESTGALTPVPGSPFSTGDQPLAVNLDPLGRSVYVANSSENTLNVYSLDRTSGALTLKQKLPTGNKPRSIALQSDKFVYVANYASNSISVYAVDVITAALTELPGSPFFSGGNGPIALRVDPQNRKMFVANLDGRSLTVFHVTGGLPTGPDRFFRTRGKGIAVAIAAGATQVQFKSKFAYVVTEAIHQYNVASDGTLTASLNPSVPGRFVAADPFGRFLFAAGTGNTYVVNSTTGALSPIAGVPAFAHPLAADPAGRFLFVADSSTTIGVYKISGNGALSRVASASAGTTIANAVVDPIGKYLIVAGPLVLKSFTYDALSGQLTATGSLGVSMFTPQSPQLSPGADGAFLYLVGAGGIIQIFRVNHLNGQLALIGSKSATEPTNLAMDPWGTFLYNGVFDFGAEGYRVDRFTGKLSLLSFGHVNLNDDDPFLAADFSGNFLYAGTHFLEGFVMSRENGNLSGLPFNINLANRATQIVTVGSIH